eukprot:137009_1
MRSIPDPTMTPNTSLPNHYTVHNIVHEMGTCYLHPEYHIISDLQKEYDPTNKQIPFCAGHVFGTSLNKKYEQDDTINNEIKFSEWALTEVKGKVTQKDIPGIQDKYLSKIYMGAGAAAFEIAVKKYRKVWEEIFGKRAQTKHKVRCFPKKPSRENMKRLDCTFMDFLCANGLESIIPCLVYGQSMQGYGILDRIPAFYGLLWSTPELLRSTGNILRVAVHAPNVIVLSKGYEHLWTQMVLKHQLDIRYNVEVTEVDRDLENNGNRARQKKIRIKYKQKTAASVDEEDTKYDQEEEMEVDLLFVACGCKK